MKILLKAILLLLFVYSSISLEAQSITGIWRGKINGTLTELKIIRNGDQLAGVAYYYHNRNIYKKYNIKGHFDPETNSVIWWDEILLEEQGKIGILQIKADPEAQML